MLDNNNKAVINRLYRKMFMTVNGPQKQFII